MTILSSLSLARAALVTEAAMAQTDVLVLPHESAFVRETPTGLRFDPETPIEVWSLLTVRLIVQHKRIEFALADAINFGRDAYGDLYAQWVQETGLNKRTLQNYARVGQLVEPARRRATISFSHHEAVASLPAPEQESLLNRAESNGWTRYDLRDAVRERKAELAGRAVAVDGTATDAESAPLPLSAADLTDEARAALDYRLAGVGKAHRTGYERGFVDALLWGDVDGAFKDREAV